LQRYERDLVGQPDRVEIVRPTGAALYDVEITRNPYGAISSITDRDGTGLDHTAAFTYDGAARLTGAAIGAEPSLFRFRYQYDGLQNMIRREAQGPTSLGLLTGEYRYGEPVAGLARGPRQLTSVLPDSSAGSPPDAAITTFDYDGAGRVTRQGDLALDYNGFDELVRIDGIVGPDGALGAVEHAYGYDGLRVSTRDPSGAVRIWFSASVSEDATGLRDHYIRLGDRLIARITKDPSTALAQARAAVAARGRRIAAVALSALATCCLVFLLAILAVPRRRRRLQTALTAATAAALLFSGCATSTSLHRAYISSARQVLYYHATVAAGPSIITRTDATIFEERRYEPFGEPIDAYRELSSGGTELGQVDYQRDDRNHLNKQTDPATGWSYHGARWMAPETARWLTPDPPVKTPDPKFMESPWSLHPYQYVEQNPVLFWDPDGQEKAMLSSSFADQVCMGRGGCSHKEWTRYRELAQPQGDIASLHTALDIAGIFDPTGIADGFNCLLYLAEGDLEQAALSAASALPGGDVVKLRKTKKIVDALDEAGNAKRMVGKGGGGGLRVFHGTDVDSAVEFLNGQALSAAKAAGKKIDGPAGFFMATVKDDAVFFAARRQGTVLEISLSERAVNTLRGKGMFRQPIPAGRSARFAGDEFVVPGEAFGTFNDLLRAGEITFRPGL
jgi:RHS repeat-associated protein